MRGVRHNTSDYVQQGPAANQQPLKGIQAEVVELSKCAVLTRPRELSKVSTSFRRRFTMKENDHETNHHYD